MNIKDILFFRDLKAVPLEGTPEFDQLSEWEVEKSTNGITIDGVHIPGWLYFHLNHWRIRVNELDDQGNIRRKTSLPMLRDNEWIRAEHYEECKKQKKGYIEIGLRQGGKDLLNSSLLYTEDGPITIEHCNIGDQIFDDQGKLTTITGKYPQGLRPVYKMTLEDGRILFCGLDHNWYIHLNSEYKVMTTRELLKNKTFLNHYCGIPLCQPVQYTKDSVKNRRLILHNILKGQLRYSSQARYKYKDTIDAVYVTNLARGLGYRCELNGSYLKINRKVSSVKIINIEYVFQAETTCITVDNESHLFLTDGYTVTHNSEMEASHIGYHATLYENSQNIVIGANGNDLDMIKDKIDFGLKNMWEGLAIPKLDKTWKGSQVKLGFKIKDGEDRIWSHIIIRNTDDGKNTEVAAGTSAKSFVYDEALEENSSLYTTSGIIKIKDVNIGDTILDETLNPTLVVDKINVGIVDTYELVLSTGEKVECSLDHIWQIKNDSGEILTVRTSDILENPSYKIPVFSNSHIDYKDITAINYVGKKQCYCIKIDNLSNLFVTNGYIITHNCGKSPFTKVLEAAKPAFESEFGLRAIPIVVGCVCAGTKVWDKEGNSALIENLKKEQGILGYKGGRVTTEDISYWQEPFYKKCYRITTDTGRILECSEDHPILCSTDGGSFRFIEAESLPINGTVVCIDDLHKSGNHFVYKETNECITSVEYIGRHKVYNLTASNTNTYLANGIVTHNTGGSFDRGEDAERLFYNPEANNFLGVMDPISGKTTGLFMSGVYKMGYKDDKTLGDFLVEKRGKDIPKDSYLYKIPMQVTDEARALKGIEEDREKKRMDTDQTEYLKAIMYYPLTPDECFMRKTSSIFNVKMARAQQQNIYNSDLRSSHIKLFSNGRTIDWEHVNDIGPISSFPHKPDVDILDAPIQVWEFPVEGAPHGLYVMGVDSYVHASSKYSSSLGAAYVFKRISNITDERKYQYRFVASYVARPDNKDEWNEQVRLMAKWYNARVLCERNEMSFIEYMKVKGDAHMLEKQLPFVKEIHPTTTVSSTDYGIHATGPIIAYRDGRLKQYLEELLYEQKDEEGNVIKSIYGVNCVMDPMLLEEIIKYDPDDKNWNGDRIVAAGLAITLAYSLDPISGQVSAPMENNMFRKDKTVKTMFTAPKTRNSIIKKLFK